MIHERANILSKGVQPYLLEQIDELLLADTSTELSSL
jgi:hypothetical protein